MSERVVGDVTKLLRVLASGQQEVMPQLVDLVYAELRKLAQNRMRQEQAGHTLSPTALVHEAYLRLARSGSLHLENRTHFFAVAARAMRRVLVDHARAKQVARRGVAPHGADVDIMSVAAPELEENIIALDDALGELAKLSPRQCQVVELRYFAGLTEDETAEVLGVVRRTVNRDWALARAWLYTQVRKAPLS